MTSSIGIVKCLSQPWFDIMKNQIPDAKSRNSFGIEFITTSPWFFAKHHFLRIAFVLVSDVIIIRMMYLSQFHFIPFWFITLIVILVSLILILWAWLSQTSKVRGHTLFKNGSIIIRNSRSGKALFILPYSWAQRVSVGDFPVKYEGAPYIPVYLIAFTREPYVGNGDSRKWIELFNLEYDDKNIIANVNGETSVFDRATNSYMDVARKLTLDLCENVGVECEHCKK